MNRPKIREIANVLRNQPVIGERLQTIVRDLADALIENETPSMGVPDARRDELHHTAHTPIEQYEMGRITHNELTSRMLRALEQSFSDGLALGRRMGG